MRRASRGGRIIHRGITGLVAVAVAACGGSSVGAGSPDAGSPGPSPSVPSAAPTSSATPAATVEATPTAAPTPLSSPIPEGAVVTVDVATGPNTLAMTADRIWVELHRDDIVASIDPTTLTVTRHPEISVHCEVGSDGADTVWATYAQTSRVTRFDAASGAVTATIPIADACGLATDAGQVWVTSPGGGVIVRLDPESGKPMLTVEVPEVPIGMLAVGDVAYAGGEGGLGWFRAFDAETGEMLAKASPDARLPINEAVYGFGSVWVTGRTITRLVRLHPDSLAIEGELDVGPEPSGIAVTDEAVWLTLLDGRLLRIDPARMAIDGSWQLDARWLAFPVPGFGRLWMTSLEDDVVFGVDLAALGD